MNRHWNVIAGIVVVHMLICAAGWFMGKIDFDTYLKATLPVVGPAIGYFMAFLPKVQS